ncbi:MAG: polysaccharide deacetylase family protein [Verrucomicrobia bacterium]|nr:polysaccharide deacetylase family protein [Verrucomicrobiota bacterium]
MLKLTRYLRGNTTQRISTFTAIALVSVFLTISLRAAESPFELREGGIIRGPKLEKRIALEFTAHDFGDGGETILNELAKHKAKASFFFTGHFLRKSEFKPLIKRVVADGHYVGPHSDAHLLYCPWTGEKKTLISKELFRTDLDKNIKAIEAFGVPRSEIKYFVPPYEWFNQEIVDWSKEMDLTLINFSPGTRSTADYTEDTAKNFVSSEAILESILKKEREDPNGLNGFLLLLHFGVSDKRTDKFHKRFGELMDVLSSKGYQFVRVDELLTIKDEN